MRYHFGILVGAVGICVAADTDGIVALASQNTRVSPIDGSIIALPTQKQLDYQDKEITALIHFEIATWLDIKFDGCNRDPKLVPNVKRFAPTALNTDQWLEAMTALGAKSATLVAKHNCGFATWPSEVKFHTIDGNTTSYGYTIANSPVSGVDMVKDFVASANKYGLGTGLYYSTVVNNLFNVQQSKVRGGQGPHQLKVTEEVYDGIVIEQLTELWKNYGPLTEIWFDGGYSAAQGAKITTMLAELQPDAAVFNACDQKSGTCLTPHSIRWVGNELGEAPEPNWSTGNTDDGGDPKSPFFNPAECDTTLYTPTRWFFGDGFPLRNISELVGVYHTTVGRNCILELDFSPDTRGLIPDSHVALYKQLGDFVRTCYNNPINSTETTPQGSDGSYSFKYDTPTLIDRIVLMEDQTNGQVIRSYSVYVKMADVPDAPWTLVSQGTSVGHKKIDLFVSQVSVMEVMVNSTFVDVPKWRSVAAHFCDRF
ncbi:hypothetical protein HYALB_00003207 [Hymenoscyphus albidus]|uniref:alpha-L-fucosidase n=1 Tax=Hymenoscyphus albidus TaxID=595503 RepID=A0A9N9LVR7_9HELO|nr:hypothetical protein HYALB_00003207 [Hymenoscyphus albidus]